MHGTRLKQPRIKFLKVTDRRRDETLRVIRIPRHLARLLYIQEGARKLDPYPLQVADPAG
jgi:hypothetical protein